jgi:hypothetical protein
MIQVFAPALDGLFGLSEARNRVVIYCIYHEYRPLLPEIFLEL